MNLFCIQNSHVESIVVTFNDTFLSRTPLTNSKHVITCESLPSSVLIVDTDGLMVTAEKKIQKICVVHKAAIV